MRHELKKIWNKRTRFKGVFVRTGIKNGWKGSSVETILLKNIKDDTDKVVSDHLWFNMTKGFEILVSGSLKEGDTIEFEARVTDYERGYFGRRDDVDYSGNYGRDYKLERPTKIKIVKT